MIEHGILLAVSSEAQSIQVCRAIEHFHVTSSLPCWRTKTIHFLSPRKYDLFSCKTVSLFQPSKMATVKTLYWWFAINPQRIKWQRRVEANEESFVIVLQYGGNDVTWKPSIRENWIAGLVAMRKIGNGTEKGKMSLW